MKYEIVGLDGLSGSKATVYSVIIEDDEDTLFDHFVRENSKNHPAEVKSIVNRIYQIGTKPEQENIFLNKQKASPEMEYVLCTMTRRVRYVSIASDMEV